MNHSDNRPTPWTDADVEELLTDFFRSEMPPALRGLKREPVKRRSAASVSQLGVLLVAALSVMSAVILFDRSSDAPPSTEVVVRDSTSRLRDEDSRLPKELRKADGVPESSDRGYLVGTSSRKTDDSETIGPRPVEQQGELPWTELRLHDPTVDRATDALPPELLIEIYPIEGDRQSKPIPPQ